SLVNARVGDERVPVNTEPGTTRDAVNTPFTRDGHPYVLIDTAGIRRKGRVNEPLEKLAVVMALKSLERCQVAVLVIDSSEGLTAQDAHIAGYAHEAGRATVIAVNKWDLVPRGMVRKAEVVDQVRDRLPFLDYASLVRRRRPSVQGLAPLFGLVVLVALVILVSSPTHRTFYLGIGAERLPTRPFPLPPLPGLMRTDVPVMAPVAVNRRMLSPDAD